LCGALEFAEKISKSGTQPIIGTQIRFKIGEITGLLPLFALNENGYKNIIDLSSSSYLENNKLSDPHVKFNKLLSNSDGVAVFSGTSFGLFGQLFDKGKFTEIHDLYYEIKKTYGDRFYIEIQRHNDKNEIGFEKFNLNKSLELEIPIIATNEVFYLKQDMHEAHDTLICIGNKTYVNEKNRLRYSDQHYFKNNSEMSELFADIPESLENNYNFPFRCNYKPLFSTPVLPNISSDKEGNADDILKKNSFGGLRDKFNKVFDLKNDNIEKNPTYLK
jgi:DNA polymerase III, alpha subunit